jgi:predicted ATPase
VTLRAARTNDFWRKVFKRGYSVRLDSLQYNELRGFENGSIQFKPGITAIVGGNGVGKSTLAHATIEVLGGAVEYGTNSFSRDRLRGSQLVASVAGFDAVSQVSLHIDHSGTKTRLATAIEGEFVWFDPSQLAMMIQNQVRSDSNFNDLLEAAGRRVSSRDELSNANFIVGKDYSKLEVWEIVDYGTLPVLPYFRVHVGDVTYGAENMGRGELALLSALWMLNRLQKRTILAIEEPENYVSSRSQNAFMDLVARACVEKELWVVVTTHSPVVIQNLPKEHIILLNSDGASSRVVPSPSVHQVAAILGGGTSYNVLLLTEDECASSFALALCEFADDDLWRQLSAVAMGGKTEIEKVLGALPKPARWLNVLVGVYDGDIRNEKRLPLHWRTVFLPGELAPEDLLRSAVDSDAGRDMLAEFHGVSLDNIRIALEAVRGVDCHDWLEGFSESIGPDKKTVTRSLVRAWCTQNSKAAKAFVDELREAIG